MAVSIWEAGRAGQKKGQIPGPRSHGDWPRGPLKLQSCAYFLCSHFFMFAMVIDLLLFEASISSHRESLFILSRKNLKRFHAPSAT